MELKIEYVSKESLKPYFHNAKLHPEEQVEQIKKSIEEFGFNDPIAIWGDNEIVEGHGRLLAVMDMPEIDTVPIIRLDHLNDEEKRAYSLAHNKLTMNSDFDMDILNLELEDIENINMEAFGFINDFIDEGDIDGGEIQDKTAAKVAVKMVFENTKEWKKHEEETRSFVDNIEGVSISVGEFDEN